MIFKKRIDPLIKHTHESFKSFTGWYLETHIRRYAQRSIPDYYVDENNCLQTNIVIKPRQKQPLSWQTHYKLKQEKKKKKHYKSKAGLIQLKMINRPDLFSFYNKIKQEHYQLSRNLADCKQRYLKNTLSAWDIRNNVNWNRYMYKNALKDIPKIEKLQYQIENLEKGNFNIFYEDAAYLYNQQKECHHFETP